MKGKDLCEFLKNVRRKLAEANGISYEPRECTHKGDCPGTCPLCDAEMKYLLDEFDKMEKDGKQLNIDVLSEEEKEFFVYGTIRGEKVNLPDDKEEVLTGDVPFLEEELHVHQETGIVEPLEEEARVLMGEPRLPREEEILAGIPAIPYDFRPDEVDKEYVRDRIDNAVYGAIIGDIVGSRFEFNPTNDYDFELFDDECNFTDDTICTIAVADALLQSKDFGESIHEWCRRYPYPMGGYGGSFHKWVLSNNPQPYNSFGNGAAMRVSPIACWYGGNVMETMKAAEATAAPTHNHPEGIKGAKTVALAIARTIRYNKLRKNDEPSNIEGLLQYCVKFSGYDINLKDEDVRNRFDETCQGTVPVALWIISQSKDFEDAIRRAVSLGADADTLGAIVGSIAGAIWGVPDWMAEKAMEYLPHEMKRVLHEFFMKCYRKREIL